MILNEPIFPGKGAMDQLTEIVKIIGVPSQEDIINMNPDSKPNALKLPSVKPVELKKV